MPSRWRISGVALLLCLGVSSCYGQQFGFRHYGAAEGLQNLAVLSLAQDGAGFLWAGTEGGLYRYDGTRFRLMGAAEGLPCVTEVQGLHVSADGFVWANLCSQLYRFDGRRFLAVQGVTGMLNRSQAMADGPDGTLVVATAMGLLEVTAGRGDSLIAHPYLATAGRATRGIFRQGRVLWFGCESRLCAAENGVIREYGESAGLPSDSWDAIAATPDGTVWARSTTKLYRKAADSPRFDAVPRIAPSMYWGALSAAADGTLLVATDRGVATNEAGQWNLFDESRGLRTSMTSAALIDRGGSLWIALVGAGIARRLGNRDWEGWTKAQGLPSNLIWNILRDRSGALWVGTGEGLARLAGKLPVRTWSRSEGIGGENVRWLGETADGAIWAITKPGWLSRIDPASGAVRAVRKEDGLDAGTLNRGLVDHAGRIWIAANTGLFRNDAPAGSGHFTKVNPPGVLTSAAWSVTEDHRGTVFAIGPDGLWRLKDGAWRQYTRSDGLLNESPYIAAVAPDDSLWLRHRYDAGVERVEFSGDRIVRSTSVVPAGASSVDVTAFHGFDAAGGFWRGTAAGVAVLRNGAWTQYTTEDGLIWNDCDGEAFWADADGSVWLGTSGGLSHFRPATRGMAQPIAEPILSSLEVLKSPRLVRVSFSSLQYPYEQLVRFGYRLDEGAWTEAQERSVAIASPGPGHHRLEVRSQVRNGPFASKLAVAQFYVEPMWWETWWFRALALLFCVASVYGAVLWRNRALQQRNKALERAVRERTAELETERARTIQEKQRADAASEAKGQFLANMSHEIRTPLNGLLGLTNLLEDNRDPAETKSTIGLIRSSGQMLLGIINDVLDFSKVEAGKLELDLTPFDLRLMLEHAVGLFRPAAAEKGLYLKLDRDADLPAWVMGDEIRLRQVLQNLVSNSLKFTASGGITVSAAVERSDAEASVIGIRVCDTGIGIPADRIPALFSSFTQADSSITRRYGGTGLGLAISKRLVELMGGSIAVESEAGRGATFRFTVRLGIAARPEDAGAVHAADCAFGHLRVLLAEDNKVNQMVGLKLLQKLGIAADVANDGAQAIAAVRSRDYDVVLMDVQMPEIDGMTATREIRAQVAPHRQPFICGLSAHATSEFQEMCHHVGMDAYLTKPVDLTKLRAMLAERAATFEGHATVSSGTGLSDQPG